MSFSPLPKFRRLSTIGGKFASQIFKRIIQSSWIMTNFFQEVDRDSLYCNVSVQSLLGQFVRSSFCSWTLRFIRKMKSNGAKSYEKFYENTAGNEDVPAFVDYTVLLFIRKRDDFILACHLVVHAERFRAHDSPSDGLNLHALCDSQHFCRRAQRQVEQESHYARLRFGGGGLNGGDVRPA